MRSVSSGGHVQESVGEQCKFGKLRVESLLYYCTLDIYKFNENW